MRTHTLTEPIEIKTKDFNYLLTKRYVIGDNGQIQGRLGKPLVYEFVEPHENPESIKKRFRGQLKRVGLERHADYTLATLQPFNFLKGQTFQVLVDAILSGKSILMEGKPGTGKTSLACALGLELMLREHKVTIFRWSWFLNNLKGSFSDYRKNEIDRIASQCKLLVMDELGRDNKSKVSEFESETLFEIITSRYGNQLPSIITTNLTVEALEGLYGVAVMDRILDHKNLLLNFDQEKSYRRENPFESDRAQANKL